MGNKRGNTNIFYSCRIAPWSLPGSAWRLIAAAGLVLLLAACGGGSSGSGGSAGAVTVVPEERSSEQSSELVTDEEDLSPAYLQAATYMPDPLSLTAPSYMAQLGYGVTLIGAHRLHWSMPSALGHAGADDAVDHLSGSGYIRGRGVTVAVVDTGIDVDHPDLSVNIFIPPGWSAGQVDDSSGHGTAVAGIIAARLNTSAVGGGGIVGVAPEATILPLKDNGLNFQALYAQVTINRAFVVNNSWALSQQWLEITVGAGALYDAIEDKALPAGAYQIRIPMQAIVSAPAQTLIFRPPLLDIPEYRAEYDILREVASAGSVLLVFGRGNNRWNSETGNVDSIIASGAMRGNRAELLLAKSNLVTLTVTGVGRNRIKIINGRVVYSPDSLITLSRSTVVHFGENVGDLVNRMALDYPAVTDSWLNVVAVDEGGRIADFSNGCGETKARCLAAPGVNISTTDKDNGYKTASGTSFSAPHVSGAAALLKGAFPNLTPRQVGNILLESADGKNDCAAALRPKTDSCSEAVYGHGILNVSAAFAPSSFMQFAAPDDGSGAAVDSGFSIAESRIQLSPAFGAAPWRSETLNAGGLDEYGRVFYTHVGLSDGVIISKPLIGEDGGISGSGIHRIYAAPLVSDDVALEYIAGEKLASARWRQSHQMLSYGAVQSPRHQSHFISLRHGDSRLGWHYRRGQDGLGSAAYRYWQAPFDGGSVHQLQWGYPLSAADGLAPQLEGLLGGGDGVRQLAGRLHWRQGDWQWSAEGGLVQESARVLGAQFDGGFSLHGADTVYRRLRAAYEPAGDLRLFADYVQSDSTAVGGGGLVRALNARADAWGAGLDYRHWRFQVSQPLAIRSGGMDLSYISGYTASGDYAVAHRHLDLSSGRRALRTSLLYTREAVDGLDFALGLDIWRNAPSRQYAGEAVVGSGALRYRFR